MTSGVPEGSHLGPLLFILYFDDVFGIFKRAECTLFADDLEIVHVINRAADTIDLQDNIDAFSVVCKKNKS